jgi:hypothetical protein
MATKTELNIIILTAQINLAAIDKADAVLKRNNAIKDILTEAEAEDKALEHYKIEKQYESIVYWNDKVGKAASDMKKAQKSLDKLERR